MPTSWEQQLRGGPMMDGGPPSIMDKENEGIYNRRLRSERVTKKNTGLTLASSSSNSLQPSRDTNIQKVSDGISTHESKQKPIERVFERILRGDGRVSTRAFLKGKFLGKVS